MRLFLLFALTFLIENAAAQILQVIPLPNNYRPVEGEFLLSTNSTVEAGPGSEKVAQYFQREVLHHTGITANHGSNSAASKIKFTLMPGVLGYSIRMSPDVIDIKSSTDEGLFNGAITVLQMARKTAKKTTGIALQCWNIQDSPRYEWRGIMLDESRHFSGIDKVKQILDWMAYYKLNRFHWHLTDQPGWRLEVKQYPRLGTVGGIGNHNDPTAPSKYYTQQQISEIVAYASERFITVIPEIDMPGHATAANLSYPEFSGGGSEKYPEFTFNPGKEEVYSYLTNILKEVDVLFPSQMIHLGADEVSFGNQGWNTDPKVQKLMKDHKLKDLKAVEEYFVSRIGDSILAMNNKILAWDEAAGSSLPADRTIIFWWRHDQEAQLQTALKKGFSVVLCPRLPFYLDFVQDSTHDVGRKWKGDYNPLKDVYQYSLTGLSDRHKSQILGIQGNLWTETVQTERRLDYLLFPRISAVAEAAWTESGNKDFEKFQSRLKEDLILYQKEDIYYYDPTNPIRTSEPFR